MKWKWIIALIVVLTLSSFVEGAICESIMGVGESCTMVTPVVSCSDNYTLLNASGNVSQTGVMYNFSNGVYSFNLSLDAGTYLVVLCDNHTRELFVGLEDEDMAWTSIVLAVMALAFLFAYISFNLKSKKLMYVKLLFFVLAVFFTFVTGFLPMAISLNPSNVGSVSGVTIALFTILALLFVLFVWLYSVYWMRHVLKDGDGDE